MAKRRRMIDTSVPEDEVDLGPSRTDKRTERKNRHARIDALARRLAALPERSLLALDLGESIERELRVLGSLSAGGALPRQRRRVASLLRPLDLDEVEQRLTDATGENARSRASSLRLERLRASLVEGGDDALRDLFRDHPSLDRQQIRKAVRAARSEAQDGGTGRRFRMLYQLLKELGLGRAEG
ncbi:MAG TPA: DUF615 domain-containing protein [Polyangiaceae bacterium]|nr:DUF615 domain-containing protein [Polyangiaceae bacterium]